MMTSSKWGCVTNICIKQIMHSFCVYNQSLTTASGSRFFGSVVRALDFWQRGPGFDSRRGRIIFSCALFLFVTVSCRKTSQRTTKALIRLRCRRLICAFVVHIWQKQVFSWGGPLIPYGETYVQEEVFVVIPIILVRVRVPVAKLSLNTRVNFR